MLAPVSTVAACVVVAFRSLCPGEAGFAGLGAREAAASKPTQRITQTVGAGTRIIAARGVIAPRVIGESGDNGFTRRNGATETTRRRRVRPGAGEAGRQRSARTACEHK